METYADIGPGEVCALFGSTDHLELAANAASASERLDLKVGATVRITTQGAGRPGRRPARMRRSTSA